FLSGADAGSLNPALPYFDKQSCRSGMTAFLLEPAAQEPGPAYSAGYRQIYSNQRKNLIYDPQSIN
ncbi:MAG TPA: hypothetical protein VGB67_06510, partial [Fibrella sp.]